MNYNKYYFYKVKFILDGHGLLETVVETFLYLPFWRFFRIRTSTGGSFEAAICLFKKMLMKKVIL